MMRCRVGDKSVEIRKFDPIPAFTRHLMSAVSSPAVPVSDQRRKTVVAWLDNDGDEHLNVRILTPDDRVFFIRIEFAEQAVRTIFEDAPWDVTAESAAGEPPNVVRRAHDGTPLLHLLYCDEGVCLRDPTRWTDFTFHNIGLPPPSPDLTAEVEQEKAADELAAPLSPVY